MTPDEKFQKAIEQVKQGAKDLHDALKQPHPIAGSIVSECLNASLSLWHTCHYPPDTSRLRTAIDANVQGDAEE